MSEQETMNRQASSFDADDEGIEACPLFFAVPGGKYDDTDFTVSYAESIRLLNSAPGKPIGRDDWGGGCGGGEDYEWEGGCYGEEGEESGYNNNEDEEDEEENYDEEGNVIPQQNKKKKKKKETQSSLLNIERGHFPPNPNHKPMTSNNMGFDKHITDHIDHDELLALSAFKSGGVPYTMNAWISAYPTGDEQHDRTVVKHISAHFNLLYRALEKLGPTVQHTYRGQGTSNKMLRDVYDNYKTLCKPGNLVSLKTMSSFSTERSVSEGFAGANGILFDCEAMECVDIEGAGYGEYEVLPLAPIQFEILSAEKESGGLLVLKLKQIFHKQRRFVVPRVGMLANLGEIDLHVEEDRKKTNVLSGAAGNEHKVKAISGGAKQTSKMRFCQMCGIKIPYGVENCKCFTAAAKAAKAARKFWICPKCGSTCEGEKCEMCSAPTQEEKKPQGKWDDELAQIKKVVEEPPCSDEKLIQLLEKKRGDVASVLEALWEM